MLESWPVESCLDLLPASSFGPGRAEVATADGMVDCPTRPWSRQAPQRRLRLKVKDVGQTLMRSFICCLCLMASGCSGDKVQSTIQVPGVGHFAFEPGGYTYRHYVCLLSQHDASPIRVIAYLQSDAISEQYAKHVRRVVDKVVPGHVGMIRAARAKITELMTSYGLDVPDDFGKLAESLELTHVKPTQDGGVELIFKVCPWFPNFDLNAALDPELEIAKVWFDG